MLPPQPPTPRWFIAAIVFYLTLIASGAALITWAVIEAVLWVKRH